MKYLILLTLCVLIVGCDESEKMIEGLMSEPLTYDDMVLVPAGEFLMGCDVSKLDWDPTHALKNGYIIEQQSVYVDAFYIDTHEVTVGEWKAFLEASGYKPEQKITDRYAQHRVNNQHPVTFVSHADATAYATFYGKRLPTETEWEKAARGGLVGKDYVWGDNSWDGSQANFKQGTADNTLRAVGSYPPNAFGLYDMSGNVAEWLSDSYSSFSKCRTAVDEKEYCLTLVRGGSFVFGSPLVYWRTVFEHGRRNGSDVKGFRCVADVHGDL